MEVTPTQTRCAMKKLTLMLTAMVMLASMLTGCVGHHLSKDPHRIVRMTYVHVANVYQLMTADGALSPQGAGDRGFWAVFDICSLDMQGMNLKGFTFDAHDFYITVGNQRYEASRPYRVLTTFAGDADAADGHIHHLIAHNLGLAPEQQYFPKETYPVLAYRLAIAIPEWPDGYLGGSLTLKHSDPQTMLDNVSDGQPLQWQQYDRASSGPLPSPCSRRSIPAERSTSIQP